MSARSLYICYFGIREPLVQTQVLPYLREIGKGGTEVSILTFEPTRGDAERAEFEILRGELAGEGIDWHWLPYHKRFSVFATAWDIFRGSLFVRKYILRMRPDIIHARVHVPTIMGALARRFSRRKPRLLFDIRGFFPEEYTDAGVWPERGWLYRSAKRVERWLMREADGFVVLTEKARSMLFPESAATGYDSVGRPVEVIPCCVDLDRFAAAGEATRTEVREELGIDGRYTLAYVGAFGGWYLTEETAELFGALKRRRHDAFAMILTQSKPEMIEPLLRRGGYGAGEYVIRKVLPGEIPRYLSAADAAVSFIKKCYSKQASSPTKNAEYLACGLPIIANSGVGDVDLLIESQGVGALVHEFSEEGYAKALDEVWLLNGIGPKCKEAAAGGYHLEKVGGERYRRLYERLLSR